MKDVNFPPCLPHTSNPPHLQSSPFHHSKILGQCCKVIPGLIKDLGVNTLNTSSQEQSAISPGLNKLKSSPYTNSVWCSSVSTAIFIVKSHNLWKGKNYVTVCTCMVRLIKKFRQLKNKIDEDNVNSSISIFPYYMYFNSIYN